MRIVNLLGCLILGGALLAGCGNDSSPNSTVPAGTLTGRANTLVLPGISLQIPDSGFPGRSVSFPMHLNLSVKDSLRIDDWLFGFSPACSLKVIVRWQPTSSYVYAANTAQPALLGYRLASDSTPWRDSGKILSGVGVGSPGGVWRAALVANSSEAVGVRVLCPESSPLVGQLDGILQSIQLTRP